MFKINIIKRTFVRQQTADDCGLACLAMVANYSGQENLLPLLQNISVPKGGLSLLALKNIGQSFNLSSRCVELELVYLRNIQRPCILHMTNELGYDHFQVCYGSRKVSGAVKYLIADPAIQVHYMDEAELYKRWISKAALWFDDLPENLSACKKSPLFFLINPDYFPAGLWVIIPIISLCIAAFGIALTWLLQRGLNNAQILQDNVIVCLIILLLVICVFKSLFSFLRQYILIKINMNVNKVLMNLLVNIFIGTYSKYLLSADQKVKTGLVNIQKMQNAVSAFVGAVISDGSLVITLFAGMFYILPLAGIITIVYLLLISLFVLIRLPQASYEQGLLRELSSETEKSLAEGVKNTSPDRGSIDFTGYLTAHNKNLNVAKSLALKVSRQFLFYECMGALIVVVIFAIGIIEIKKQVIDYTSFMLVVIEAYLISALMPKICAAFQQIAEGVDAAIQLGYK